MAKRRNLIRDREALTTVEFVVIFPFFFILVLYALQVVLALFWWQSVEDAAQLGARLAVVWTPAVVTSSGSGTDCPATSGTLPLLNCLSSGGTFGGACSDGNCDTYDTVSCTGGTSADCDPAAFEVICERMRYTFGGIPDGCPDVTVTYGDAGLGFAGGPVIPNVKVTVSNVPFNVIAIPILPNIVSTLPDMSATLTGEDLSSSGGS